MSEKKSCSCASKSDIRSGTISAEAEMLTGNNFEGKHTSRSSEQKKKLINRLSRIEGQVRGLKRMIEDDVYCYDVLTQSAATSSALNSFSKELLSAHVHGCVVRDIQAGDVEVVDELMDIMQKLMR